MIADGRGGAWAVGPRDCSCQRRNQKVIEESSSPALVPEQEREVLDAARRLALRAGYRSAGTVEFLYEPATQAFSFIGVDAWLQDGHPVTEAVTGLDLVKLQLHVAAGGRLEGEPPAPTGHAVEARLNAEDPALGFGPAPGRIALLRLPTGPGVRVDTGVAEGDVIPAEFDSTIAKVTAWGNDRDEALARLRRALAETMVVVDGGTTNQGLLLELLDRPEVRSGDVDTAWLDRLRLGGEIVPVRHADVALLQAAIALADGATADERARFYAFARRGRPQAGADLANGRAAPPRAVLPPGRVTGRAGPPPRRGRRRDLESEPKRSAATSIGSRCMALGHRTLTSSRTRTCSSRWTACRTGSRATTAASSAVSRPPWWCRSPLPSVTRSTRAASSRSSRP